MTLMLHRLGAHVTGFSLPEPVSAPSLFEAAALHGLCDDRRGEVRDLAAVEAALTASRAEILIHMAAQPIVRMSVRDPLETLDVNVMGVAKVLDAARRAPLRASRARRHERQVLREPGTRLALPRG